MHKVNFNYYKDDFLTTNKRLVDVLRFAATKFQRYNLVFGHGTDNAWDEACLLLQLFCKIDIHDLEKVLDANLLFHERKELFDILYKRIVLRKPLAYIFNQAILGNLTFYVDSRVLIPRSPIIELINNNFANIIQCEPSSVLELGTGSGCIACCIAANYPQATVDAVDISDDALNVAKINAKEYELTNLELKKSDLFESIDKNKKYDLIIANLPYATSTDMNNLPAEYKHEPKLALAAGEDGLYYVYKVLQQAAEYLTEEGIIIIEVGYSQENFSADLNDMFNWIDFADGNKGVFYLTKTELLQIQKQLVLFYGSK